MRRALIPILGLGFVGQAFAFSASFDVREATVAGIHNALFAGITTCRGVVSAFISRIEEFNPQINAIIALNPQALSVADDIDIRIASGNATGALLCVPVLLKDNYDFAGMPTTGGSRVLADNYPKGDAPTVRAMKDAGAIILGKANLHEFALEGISASTLGGQTINPYDLARTPGGSSGGSGAAIGANLAVIATGTDTVNSLRSPASANSLFSFRPTRGLISRAGVIPVSYHQDTLGAMARNPHDLAIALSVMASVGYDPRDNETASIPPDVVGKDYSASLHGSHLKGLRLGLLQGFINRTASPETTPVNDAMDAMVAHLTAAGAEVIPVADALYDAPAIGALDVQRFEYRELLDEYLSRSSPDKSFHSIYSNLSGGGGPGDFLVLPSQYSYIRTAAVSSTTDADYTARLRDIRNLTRHLQATFQTHDVDALIYPEQRNLVVPLGSPSQAGRNGILAALTGHPVVVVPAGFSTPTASAPIGVPVGMEILGRPWSDGFLLNVARQIGELVPVRRMAPFANASVEEVKSYEAVPVIRPDAGNIPAAYPLGVY